VYHLDETALRSLRRFGREQGKLARFNVEARRRYLTFATSAKAAWTGNFREVSASVTRMATLADAGRITEDNALQEVERLQRTWTPPLGDADGDIVSRTLGARVDEYDLFDRLQLQRVLEVCEASASLSEAGRTLFAISRQARKQPNDADRLRKYLARFGVEWGDWLNPHEA
jgi:transcriptional regulatory protein RtcR